MECDNGVFVRVLLADAADPFYNSLIDQFDLAIMVFQRFKINLNVISVFGLKILAQ